MADDGNTMWNGKYGATEKKRRETYPRAERELLGAMSDAASRQSRKKPDAPDWGKYIKDIPK